MKGVVTLSLFLFAAFTKDVKALSPPKNSALVSHNTDSGGKTILRGLRKKSSPPSSKSTSTSRSKKSHKSHKTSSECHYYFNADDGYGQCMLSSEGVKGTDKRVVDAKDIVVLNDFSSWFTAQLKAHGVSGKNDQKLLLPDGLENKITSMTSDGCGASDHGAGGNSPVEIASSEGDAEQVCQIPPEENQPSNSEIIEKHIGSTAILFPAFGTDWFMVGALQCYTGPLAAQQWEELGDAQCDGSHFYDPNGPKGPTYCNILLLPSSEYGELTAEDITCDEESLECACPANGRGNCWLTTEAVSKKLQSKRRLTRQLGLFSAIFAIVVAVVVAVGFIGSQVCSADDVDCPGWLDATFDAMMTVGVAYALGEKTHSDITKASSSLLSSKGNGYVATNLLWGNIGEHGAFMNCFCAQYQNDITFVDPPGPFAKCATNVIYNNSFEPNKYKCACSLDDGPAYRTVTATVGPLTHQSFTSKCPEPFPLIHRNLLHGADRGVDKRANEGQSSHSNRSSRKENAAAFNFCAENPESCVPVQVPGVAGSILVSPVEATDMLACGATALRPSCTDFAAEDWLTQLLDDAC